MSSDDCENPGTVQDQVGCSFQQSRVKYGDNEKWKETASDYFKNA